MGKFQLKTNQPFRLVLAAGGPHRFGGPVMHQGASPAGSDMPLHLMLLLDLTDENCPIEADDGIRFLPLYYPLAYGYGGGAVQYAVISDAEIQILHLSDELADPPEERYIKVDALPASAAKLVPLTYEEDRVVVYRRCGGHFQPDDRDRAILENLDQPHDMIPIGGRRPLRVNSGEVICRNPACKSYEQRAWFDLIAEISPVPVGGKDDFWYEYQGGYVWFCFGICRQCGTIIAFNVAL